MFGEVRSARGVTNIQVPPSDNRLVRLGQLSTGYYLVQAQVRASRQSDLSYALECSIIVHTPNGEYSTPMRADSGAYGHLAMSLHKALKLGENSYVELGCKQTNGSVGELIWAEAWLTATKVPYALYDI
ncbi:hypothetical protein [Microbispora sp. NPDC046933]|uniref:hypothetical protein n=1 Tax=Microbispora sp. NPDC046933 TaxID=3155618 RepID=UPI0033C98260